MSVQLLDKTRKINKLLHNNHSHKVVFNDICEVLGEILESNILVISKKGKVLGVAICPGIDEIEELIADQVGGYIDGMLTERLLSVLSTKECQSCDTGICRGECQEVSGYHYSNRHFRRASWNAFHLQSRCAL